MAMRYQKFAPKSCMRKNLKYFPISNNIYLFSSLLLFFYRKKRAFAFSNFTRRCDRDIPDIFVASMPPMITPIHIMYLEYNSIHDTTYRYTYIYERRKNFDKIDPLTYTASEYYYIPKQRVAVNFLFAA